MKYTIKNIIFIAAIALGSLVVADTASAATYPAGTLVKEAKSPAVFYLASDGKRYHIPDGTTYFTWYRDFRKVKTISAEVAATMPIAAEKVTAHPGTVLVKFPGNRKVYAVGNGGTLHWIETASVARKLYGYDWPDRLRVLPSKNFAEYTVGDAISDPSQFSRNEIVVASRNIDADLGFRLAIEQQKFEVAQKKAEEKKEQEIVDNTVYSPALTSLGTSLKYRLSPGFHPNVRFYWVTAEAHEDTVDIHFTAEDPRARVTINGLQAIDGSLKIPVRTGKNRVTVRIRTSKGETRNYYITISREKANNNQLLHSIYENLRADVSPAFHPGVTEYTLRAGFEEETIDLRPVADDNRSTIYINGDEVSQYRNQTYFLDVGVNRFNIEVVAQSGAKKRYELDVYRSPAPNFDAMHLNSLHINLENNYTPAFDPHRRKYFVNAKEYEERVDIVATPKHNYARVLIDGSDTQRKSVRLFAGRNEITITVDLDTGHSTEYTLVVNKAYR